MNSKASLTRYLLITGVLYLIIFCLGLFSEIVVRSSLISPGDATATANNILASQGLFRLGFAGDLVVFLCDVAVAMLLYVLLRSTSEAGALVSSGFRLTGTAIYGVNLLNYFAALLVLNGSGPLAAFSSEQLNSLALLFLEIHKHGYDLGLVFFGLHCLVLGYLLYKSDLFPSILGLLMALAGLGYLVGSATLFLWPRFAGTVEAIYILPVIGELAFSIWLVVKGLRMGKSAP